MRGYLLQYRNTTWQPAAPGSYVPVERVNQKPLWWTHQGVAEIARECLGHDIRRNVVVIAETIPADLQAAQIPLS